MKTNFNYSKLFKYRGYTPVPFLLIMFFFQNANVWSLITGFIMVLLGESLRLWGVAWAGSETRTTGGVGGTFLIISGPFAHTRNPLYIGNIFIYLGFGIMSFALFPYLQIAALIFFCLQYHFIVLEEEKYLRTTYTKDFEEFIKNVPRFGWRFKPYRKSNVVQPPVNWSAGLRSEKRTLQSIAFVLITLLLLWFIRRF